MHELRTWLTSAAILLATATAGAETKPDARPQPRDYSYSFSDDGLLGDGLGSTVPRISIRPNGGRGTLIRPRTNFVIELLKTVETL